MAQATSKSRIKPETYKNYIGGRWVKPANGAMMENRNPADTRDIAGLFPASTAEDVDAGKRPAMSRVSAGFRFSIIAPFAGLTQRPPM